MIEQIEARRARARRLAVWLYAQSATVLAVYVSLMVLVLVLGIVRLLWVFGSEFDTIEDTVTAGLAIAGGLAAVTFLGVVTLLLAWWWARGGAVLLRKLDPHALPETDGGRVSNIVEALSIGLGIEPPQVRQIDSPVPNGVAFEARRTRYLLVTSGALALPRPELEALLANLLARMVTGDSSPITRALLAVVAADRFTRVGYFLGSVCFMLVALALEAGVFLWTWALMGGLWIGLSVLVSRGLDSRADRLAAEADAVADLATVALTSDPGSLASLMRRVAGDERETKVPDRYGRLFFRHVLAKVRLGDDLFEPEAAPGAAPGASSARAVGARAKEQRGLTDRAAAVEQIHGLPAG
jgi:Zn-dependent protease with chaperone function